MRKSVLFTALVVAMSAVSCVQDINDDAPVNNDGVKTFEASFGAMGKAVLEPGETESKVAWEVNDQVSVLAGGENFLYTAASAGYSTTLSTEATGVPSEGTFYAVYPYDNAAALADGKISTTLPAEQTAVLGSFSTHLAVAQTTGSTLAFKNVCGLVKVTVSDAEVTKVEFKGNTNEIVAGGISVTVTDTPAWTETETGSQVVTLVPAGEAATLAKGVYYLAVLPQTFAEGITVTAYKGDEAWDVRKVETPVTVERSDIKGSNSFGVEGSGTEADPYILDAAQDLVEMRNLATDGGETWFKMANDINMKGVKGYLPVNYDGNFERKIHFDGGNFTISNFNYDTAVSGASYGSLFGVLYGSVKNLKVDKATIVGNGGCGVIGGYVGTDGKPGLVENVHITNSSVTSSAYRFGGVAGITREGSFKNVSYQGTVTCTLESGAARVGGFVGQTMEDIICEGCSVDVEVVAEGLNIAGGFAGFVYDGTLTLTDCSVAGSVKGNESCGGVLGEQAESATVTATGTTSSATLTAGNYSGGFFGKAHGAVTLTDCSASGNVTAISSTSAFLAWLGHNSSATLTRCAASGTVSGNNNVGGIVGLVEDGASGVFRMDSCSYTGATFNVSGTAGCLIGYVTGQWTIKNSFAETKITVAGANCGGLIGSVVGNNLANGDTQIVSNTSLNISNCHYSGDLEAGGNYVGGAIGRINSNCKSATISEIYSTGSVKGALYVGGLIGAPMCATQSVSSSWSSSTVTSTSTSAPAKVGGLIGAITAPITITGCFAQGDVTSAGGSVGGLVGESSDKIEIYRSYSTGKVKAANSCAGGLVGKVDKLGNKIENCYSTSDVENTGQQNGGLVGFSNTSSGGISIVNSYATGDVGTGRGSAGILGNSRGPANETSVIGCIAWNKNVSTTDRTSSNYAPAAIVGSCYFAGTFENCWRRADMVLVDKINASVLHDQDNVTNAQLPIPSGVSGDHNRSYHGKAAAADATVSSVAQSLGWSSDIWDFSKDMPTLK